MKRLRFAFSLLLGGAALLAQLACSQYRPRPVSADARSSGLPALVGSIRASQLIQVSVKSGEGANLGKVEDLMVNPQTGLIEFALVSKGFVIENGSVAGVGELVVPVPWQALNLGTERRFVFNLDDQKSAPETVSGGGAGKSPGYAIHTFG